MKKPSYLFGTMHISNKMVFHLPDSFYTAIKNVDVVALELSPELWQADIPRMNRQSDAYQRFASGYSDDYVHQNTFTEGLVHTASCKHALRGRARAQQQPPLPQQRFGRRL